MMQEFKCQEYDFIVVGAGLAGGILARKLAEEKRKKILIVERRNHIAGNIFDFENEHHIRVQKYGPHVLHTSNEEVYQFITSYCTPVDYRTKCEAVIDGISTPSPFNFKTIDQFYTEIDAKKLKEKLLLHYGQHQFVSVVDMLESVDDDIREFAELLFEKDYKLYTAKQWDLPPSEIDPSVLKRVPIALSYRDTYFYDTYEFMPENGFTTMYKKIVDYPGIHIKLDTDALDYIELDAKNKCIRFNGQKPHIIYTGAIDELFDYKYGVLPYRSLDFKFKSEKMESFQNVAIVAYPQAEGYTRITEYTKMPFQNYNGWTSVAYEYPVKYDKKSSAGNEPYYPVLTQNSKETYECYHKYANQFSNLILCGRLAEYKYYNMDQVILRAIRLFEEIKDDI